eukprot:gene11296-4107_t
MNFSLLLTCFLYLTSAMSVTIVRQYLSNYGVSDEDTLLLGQVTFLAYTFSGFISATFFPEPQNKKLREKESATIYIVIYAMAGLTGNLLCNIGMTYAGSGIFQVLYSSSLIFTALISFVVNKKKTTVTQTIAIFVIVGGLSVTAIPNFFSNDKANEKFSTGIFLSLAGTFLMSIGYVLDEYLLDNKHRFQLESYHLAVRTGLLSFTVLTTYQYFYILPKWTEVTSSITNTQMVLILLFVQFSADLFNIIAYYAAISKVGATATGVIQGINTILVFIFSSILFCSQYQNQCFTQYKAISAVFVTVGVLIYTFGSPKEKTD